MFGKMMNSYYYGKSGKGDYRKEDLPKNRWQLFWEMLRIRFAGLMRLNLMYAVAWLPVIILSLFFMGFMLAGPAAGEAGEAAALTPDELAGAFQGLFQLYLFLLIPAITITGPFTAGVSYVTRNWARDEHAFVWSDFKDAVKANWKQALLISFITSVMPIIQYFCWTVYAQMAQSNPIFVVPQMLAAMLGVIWFLAVIFMYPLMITYKLKVKDLLRNALLLSIGRLPQSVGLRLLSLVPFAIAVAIGYFAGVIQWVLLGIVLYYAIIGFSFSRFVYASYTNAVFDKYINARIEGAAVNQGLSQEEDDDDEDDDEQ